MKVALVLLVLASVAVAAPAPQRRRRPGNRFGGTNASGSVTSGNRRDVTNVSAQVTNVNNNQPGTVAFNGGLALASSQQVSGFGNNIGINHAQAISQNIAIPVPGFGNNGFNQFNNNQFNNNGFNNQRRRG